MRARHLRLVSTGKPVRPLTFIERIEAAVDQMMADARGLRVAARSLSQSSREVLMWADRLDEKIPLFDGAKERLLVERDRAYGIATDAAMIERRILQSSPDNLLPLTTALPARPHAATKTARVA